LLPILKSPSRNDKIQRANLDGGNVQDLVLHADPDGIALDLAAGKMYWAQPSFGKMSRANLDGSAVEDLVTGLLAPTDIALNVTAGAMYWADGGADEIQRADLDGGGIADVVTGVSPSGLAFLAPRRLAGCLLLDLKGLVDSCEPCRLGPKTILLETIDEAIRQVKKEHSRPALNAVRLFITLTQRLVEASRLPPSEGRQFVTLAEEILRELSTDDR
jgi:hypothetical protein